MSGTTDKDDPGTAENSGSADSGDEVELEPVAGPPPVPAAKKAGGEDANDGPTPLGVTGHLPARAWPPKTVADLMTRKVLTLRQDEPIGDLESTMKLFRFRHLPVVDGDMKLVGLITLTDLLHAALGVGPDGKAIEKAGAGTLASAIMRKGVVTGQPDAPAATACNVMLQEKLGCLPVILADNTLVGIVTQTDFVRLSLEVLER